MGQTALQRVEGSDRRLGRSFERVGLVHLGEEGSKHEVEDSGEEGERDRDDEQPVTRAVVSAIKHCLGGQAVTYHAAEAVDQAT